MFGVRLISRSECRARPSSARGPWSQPASPSLIEGWASASVDLDDGECQIVETHPPGDLTGAPSVSLMETAA